MNAIKINAILFNRLIDATAGKNVVYLIEFLFVTCNCFTNRKYSVIVMAKIFNQATLLPIMRSCALLFREAIVTTVLVNLMLNCIGNTLNEAKRSVVSTRPTEV